jgi:hypothetical protein
MTEILTESFCERCGTRYTFESARPRTRLKGVRVLSRGLKNFVLSDDTSMDEAMAAARSETDRELTSHQLDAFHKTFNFCMSCRQYTCPNCWNEVENRCLSCAPHLGHEVLPAAFPDLPSGPLVSSEELYTNGAAYTTNGANGTSHSPELIGMAEVQARRDEEVDAAARLAALTAPVAETLEAPEATPQPPVATSATVEAPPPVKPVAPPSPVVPAAPIAETPIVAAAPPSEGDDGNPYDDVDTRTPSWLAKLVAANQVDEAVEARTPPPASIVPPAPAPAAEPAAPVVEPVVAPEPVVAADVAAEPVVDAAPEPVVVEAVPEPVVEAVPEPVVETVAADPVTIEPEAEPVTEPAMPPAAEPIAAIVQPAAPEPEPVIESAAAAAAAGLAAAAIHDAPDENEAAPEDTEVFEDKGAAQTSDLLERFRPAAAIAAAAAITPDPAPNVAPAPTPPVAPTPPAAARPPAPSVAEPPAPAAQPPTWVPQAPASTELAAAATTAPTPPVHDDVVPQPVWQMVAPDDVPAVVEPPPKAPAPATRAEPQWPTQPEWPSAAASSSAGLPFLGRPAQPTGGLDALWAESTREVARPAAGGRAAGGVQPCVSCGLSLSANARFCRRCGTPQGV